MSPHNGGQVASQPACALAALLAQCLRDGQSNRHRFGSPNTGNTCCLSNVTATAVDDPAVCEAATETLQILRASGLLAYHLSSVIGQSAYWLDVICRQ